ncbi:MAG: hypothetical protein AAB654_03180, partial [Acidobacteriota bacterium]
GSGRSGNRHSFQEDQRRQQHRHFRLRGARIRLAGRCRGNRAGTQVRASKGLQVPSDISDKSHKIGVVPLVHTLLVILERQETTVN